MLIGGVLLFRTVTGLVIPAVAIASMCFPSTIHPYDRYDPRGFLHLPHISHICPHQAIYLLVGLPVVRLYFPLLSVCGVVNVKSLVCTF